jgi:tetratricopeptide (TPR) repeat protein
MSKESFHALNLLYWYASEDQQWRDEIDLSFHDLKHHCHITKVFDNMLAPSMAEGESMLAQLRNTQLVLVLVSTHFKAAQAVPPTEVRKSLEWLRWSGDCLVIALLLEQVEWDGAPFVSEVALPSDGRPITEWPSRDQALQDIERGMRGAIEKLWLMRGSWLFGEEELYDEALEAYNEALRLNPTSKSAWHGKGNALSSLETPRYEEALSAYDEVLRLDPTSTWAWYGKGLSFAGLKRYEEAIQAYDQEIRINPSHKHSWFWKGEALKALGRGREAKQAKEHARQLGFPLRRDE